MAQPTGKFSLTHCNLWVMEYDIATDADRIDLAAAGQQEECTTFGSNGWREHMITTRSAQWAYEGFIDYSAASMEERALARQAAGTAAATTVVPYPSSTPALGDRAYLMQATELGITPLAGSHGSLARTAIDAKVDDGPLVRGQVEVPKAATASSSNSAGSQLGALSASERLYANLHVFAAAGTTLDVKIQSDDNAGFSSPTDRITFTQATGITAEALNVAGAITDDYWRAVWTIVGGSFTFGVSIGIATP